MKESVDVAAADAAMDALWRGSWVGTHVASIARRLRAAWFESRCRRVLAAAGLCP